MHFVSEFLRFTFQKLSFPSPSLPQAILHFSFTLHVYVLNFLYSLNLNYTWTKDEYTFDYYVGVCVAPVSTALSNCYVVQKTTKPDGEITFQCLGGNLDVQVTNTQSEYILNNLCGVLFTLVVMGTYICRHTLFYFIFSVHLWTFLCIESFRSRLAVA